MVGGLIKKREDEVRVVDRTIDKKRLDQIRWIYDAMRCDVEWGWCIKRSSAATCYKTKLPSLSLAPTVDNARSTNDRKSWWKKSIDRVSESVCDRK